MNLIDKVCTLRKLLGIATPEDYQWYYKGYIEESFSTDYFVALIELYKHYCKVQGIKAHFLFV